MMRTITVKVPEGLVARLTTLVRRRSSTRSAVVRQALEAHLERSAARDGEQGSCLDVARDLAGALRGGPRDLSSNKRHLKGYGR
jgi:Arc/MetJ-type ribon-helix-helix transcriptional regulator